MAVPIVIWLDDEPDSLGSVIYGLSARNIEVIVCDDPDTMCQYAKAAASGDARICANLGLPRGAHLVAFVVDMMLKGVVAVKGAKGGLVGTDDGYNAGSLVVTEILRANGSPWLNTPVILTSAGSPESHDFAGNKNCHDLAFCEKFLSGWESSLVDWVLSHVERKM
jgi:hypothetical protein